MAPEIVWAEVPSAEKAGVLSVLDPMAGSGTTVATARLLGHRALGIDTDPLAVIIARAWCRNVDGEQLLDNAAVVLSNARGIARDLAQADAYPPDADDETKKYVRYWFDPAARAQLTALAHSIGMLGQTPARDLLWCAFSRLIITKLAGVSLAMDVSHSRPHRTYDAAPRKPFEVFFNSVGYVAHRSPFTRDNANPRATIRSGDARALQIPPSSVNWVVTSPPYLNAIDYMRGHRLSLVWMGHKLATLRRVRSASVGSELIAADKPFAPRLLSAVQAMGDIDKHSSRTALMLKRYVGDMDRVMSEITRVLVPDGQALLVVGDSTVRNVFVSNSGMITALGAAHGLELTSSATRELPANRRYLPPPGRKGGDTALEGRMRNEVVLKFRKPF
jgi:hypothetical protein